MKHFFIVLALLCASIFNAFAREDFFQISGDLPFLKNGDSVTLVLFKYGYFEEIENFQTTYISRVTNHSFRFKIPINKHTLYFNLIFKENFKSSIYCYLIEKGDNIKIIEKKDSVIYTGQGSEKWNLTYQFRQIEGLNSLILPNRSDVTNIKKRFELLDSCIIKQLDLLNANRKYLTNSSFVLLKSDIISKSLSRTIYMQYLKDSVFKLFTCALLSYKNNTIPDSNLSIFIEENKSVLQYSWSLPLALIEKYRYDSCAALNKPFLTEKCYNYFARKYSGLLREKLITFLLLQHKVAYSIRWYEDILPLIEDAIRITKNTVFKNCLQQLKATEAGFISYNFNLPDSEGKLIRMTDFKGKVVLLDFWFTGCPNCIVIQQWLKKVEERFLDSSLIFVSISADKEKTTWLKSIKGGKYTNPGTINLYTEGEGFGHPIIQHYNIQGYPRLILIDKDGKLCADPIDPRIDQAKHLGSLIEQALSKNNFEK